jgi:hypothetical protein
MLLDVLFSSHQRPIGPNTLNTQLPRHDHLSCRAPFFTATEAQGSLDPQAAAKEAYADERSLLNRADQRASECIHRPPTPADRLERFAPDFRLYGSAAIFRRGDRNALPVYHRLDVRRHRALPDDPR